MKLGAVILVAGIGIPDEEMEKFLEMKRPTIFEQMIVSYQRAGVGRHCSGHTGWNWQIR